MLKLSTARRAACAVLLAFVALPSWAQTNRAPQIDSQPERLATVKLGFHYAVRATDADGDTLRYLLPTAPDGATIDAGNGVVQWRPQASHIGQHAFRVAVEDGKSGRAEQPFDLKVVADYCPIYPIALPKARVDGLSPGALINQLERGTGPGNFSWLTWTGANDAPTMARSLTPPGDSDTYVDPDDATDRLLNIADWAQGSPGSMNSNAIRDAMDVLKTRDIILPVWDSTRGQGSKFDYRVQRFVIVRLRDYRLTGQGWLTFEYKGEATCYNYAPSALPQTLTTREDTPLPIVLTGTDPDGDVLTFTVLTSPAHGTLSGTAPNVTYTPAPNYHGPDAFTFRVNDGRFDSAAATIDLTVTPLNDPPLANPQTLTTVEDTPLPIVLSGSDIENDALTYTVLQAPAHGTLSGSAPNLTYTPTANYAGPDAFTFRVNDGELDSAAATVNITVTPVNDAPAAQDQHLETPRDTALPIMLTGSDPDGDALQFTVVDAPAHGALSGTAPSLTFTPTAGYHGEDRFTFRVNDGALDSPLATVTITITRGNEAPQIVSPPVTVATEALAYRYDVDATDPDNDTLVYALDRSPDALAINPTSGVVDGVVDAAWVQPVRTFNSQCYVIPDELLPTDGAFIAPLYQRVRAAITKGSGYVAPQTLAWDRRNTCLGCHVQTQTLVGLQGSMERAKVDEAAAEYLLAGVLASQQPDGSIRRSHPEFSGNQTAFALWALSYVPDRARTLEVRERGLRFFHTRVRNSGNQSFWSADHNSGWLASPEAATALVALSTDRYLRDISRLPNVTAAQVELGLQLRAALPRVAEYFLAQPASSNNNFVLTFPMLGLAQVAPHLDDGALRARVDARIAQLDTTLRARTLPGGGWHITGSTAAADALTSAWVGFALDTQNPPLTDPVVLRNIEFLLDNQRVDGTWPTNSGLFSTHLGTTGLVMAYLPVALEHLGNPDLTLGHLKLEAQGDDYVLSAEAINRGLDDVEVASTVTFFPGRDASGAALGSTTVGTLRSGESRWVSITLDDRPAGDVSAAIQSAGIEECLSDNNATRAALATARATDPGSLFDTQSWLINLEDANAAPVITSAPVTAFEQGKPYTYQVTVSDPDVGDAHEFELTTAPAGLYINPLNGTFSYDLDELAAGTHAVTVRVTDLRGASALQSFQLTVIANRPPDITSTPGLQAAVGAEYRYDVDATDPDNDTLRYRLDGAPLTMSIDADTGVITWTPATLHIGNQSVAVVVEDGRGGSDRQVWTIVVATAQVNRPPTITTTAPPRVNEGQVYRYDIDATDPDGDLLQYSQVRGPQGASIVAANGVLSWTADDARLVSGIRSPNLACRTAVDTQPFQMQEKWAWTGSPQEPRYDQVLSTALVAPLFDQNNDGRIDERDSPSVVFLAFINDASAPGSGIHSARLRVIDGRTGADQAVTNASIDLDGHGTPAIGDIDVDGIPDIVSQTGDGGVAAFNGNGSVKWRVPPIPGAGRWRVAHLADLTGDGTVEIVVGDAVLDARGTVLWRLTEFRGMEIVGAAGLVSIADLDGDGSQEIVAGASAYSATGVVRWKNVAVGDGPTAIADFNHDGLPEIVVVNSGAVSLVRSTDGSRVWGPVAIPGGGRGGPPTVGDMNGDGTPEIGVAGAASYVAISAQGQLLWTAATQDRSSNVTGSTIADLDGDGRAEVLYRDELHFRIYDGSTGTVLEQVPMSSVTAVEYPVVADIDLDGEAEILVTADDLLQRLGRAGGPSIVGVRAFSSASGAWTPTRSIWNQHAYHIDNINDDGSVPRHPVKSWLTHNTFRLNTFADRHPLGLADLALFDLRLDEADGTVKVLVVNRGLAPTTAATTVRVYNGNPDNGGTLLGTLNVPVLPSNEEQTLTLSGLNASAVSTDLFARVDEAGAIQECLDDNNGTAAAYFDVRATDPAGLFDSQRFTATVENVNQAPSLVVAALPTAAVGQSYRYALQASDPDLGDGLRFELASAPVGLSIEAVSGELRWTPAAVQAGTHTVRVRVVDLGGLSVERDFELVVSTNQAPQITSTPGSAATVGTEYRYDVDATDPEGDALTYGITSAPVGMQIDATTGLIRWTPTASGSHEIEVRVSDARGAFALQRYTLQVTGPVNRPPTITSSPSQTASPGRLYTYLVDATDPDNDTLSVLLPVKPTGMTLNELSGQISWTPTAAQLGTHAVQVQVVDGRGGIATQNFSIVVSQVAGNQPPSIISTPTFTAKVGREYRYAVQGQDPDGDTLTYTLQQSPSGMTIAANGTITWTPSTTTSQTVRVRVADAGAFAEQTWTITVLAADVPLNANVNITPNPVQPGGTITVQVLVEGAAAQPTVTGTMDGQPLPLDPDGSTTVTAPTTPGSHTVVITVTDGFDTDTTTTTFNVVDPSDTVDPTATIHSPREGATEQLLVLTSPRDVVISVADDNLRAWRLLLMERGVAGTPIELASGTTAVTQQNVATLDPTLLMNGQYALVLNAEDASGNTAQDVIGVAIEGAMKLGHFSITFQDLNLPVSGIPVTVSRTYDTRQRHRALDFGQGWSLSYQNVRIHESRRPGFAWEFKVYPSGPLGLIPNYCMESALGNVVSVTLADGKVEKFRAKAFPECNQVLPLVDVELRFEPMPGTHGKLQALDNISGRLVNGSIVDLTELDAPIDPNNYKYIDADGVEFSLDQNFGLRKIQERTNDNSITFGRDGILHSNGTSVSFIRNAAGQVTRVTGPNATQLNYEYDANGNLTAFVDAGGNRTTFTYQAGHYLRDIIDARGVRVSRNEYDDDGRLIAVIDADGNRIEYTRDIDGRVETVKDRNGGTTVHVYNERGDILAETNPLGRTTHRTYDINGNELSRTDALNRTQRWTYDSLGNVLVETNGAGEKTTKVYGTFNHLLTQADNSNRIVLRNTWRNITLPGTGIEVYPGPLVNVQDANGQSNGFGYDPDTGELNRITDATGASTGIATDGRGYKIAETDALGRRSDFVNDDLGRVIEERRTRTQADGMPQTLTTRYTYDGSGNVITTEHPDGSVTRSEYDANGKVTAEIDALNRRIEREYNDRGEEIETRYPDGTSETKTYDANGNVLTQTDRGGRVTTFVYDAADRLIETIHPDAEADDGNDANNARSKNVYDVAGQLISSIDEIGNATNYQYDLAGRRTHTIPTAVNGSAGTVIDAYDTVGRRQSSTDANGHVTLYRYDAVGRLLETEHEGAISKVEYDAAGRKSSDTDPSGRITRYGYDALGRLTTVVLANPATGANPALVAGVSPDSGTLTTRYAYDEVGNKISQTDAEGRVTRWEYDAMGRETARVLPEGQRETKQYNAAGELIAHTDFNGRTTRYTYDVTGKVEAINYPTDADVSFDYNAAGERTTVTDGRGVSTMSFDRRGRVVQSHDADGGLIEYTYDDVGNLLSRVSPSQSLVYVYDARHRMTQVTRTVDGEMPTVTRYEYDQDGKRSAMLGGDGIRTEYAYDRRHRLTNLVKKTAAGALLLAMQYTVDASGMRTEVAEADVIGPVRVVAYAYDATKRLVREAIDHRDADKDRISTWSYDDVGNRLTQTVTIGASTTESTTYVYDANDRLLSETQAGGPQAGVTAYTYDDSGNTVSRTGPAGATTYAYNDANRLIQAVTPQGMTTYVYTADGLRVRKTVTPAGGAPTTTWYVQDSAYPHAQVIEEYTSQGSGAKQLAATFTFADELVSQTRYANDTPTTRFIQGDGFGSTRWLSDTSGTLTDSIDYNAFGEEIGRTGTTDVEHLYRGEAFDPNIGFYYLRARWYQPAVGRFTSVDPWAGCVQCPLSLNKYLYADADPVGGFDPSGWMTLTELSTALNTQIRNSLGSTQSYRIVFKKTGCLLVEAMTEQAITHGVYVFIDGITGLPYVGKTKNEVDSRLKQHAKQGARLVQSVVAQFAVKGGKAELQVIEQLIFDLIKPQTDLSNRIRPLSETRPDKAKLRQALSKIKLCK